MARLPSADTALGPIPQGLSGRPIATADLTGYAKGAAAIAEGVANLGKGVSSMAGQISRSDQHQQALDDDLELARAKSGLAVKELETRSGISATTGDEGDDTSGGLVGPLASLGPSASTSSGSTASAGASAASPSAGGYATPEGQPEIAQTGIRPLETHVDGLREYRDSLLPGIRDPRKRELFRLQSEDNIARTNILAQQRANGIAINKQLVSLTQRGQSVIAQGVESDDPEANSQAISGYREEIYLFAKKGWITHQQADRLDQNWKNQYGEAKADAMVRKGKTDQAISELEAASLNASMAPTPKKGVVGPQSSLGGLNENRIAQINAKPEVARAIEQAAAKHGLDPDFAKVVASIESGGNPNAKTGSYEGVFQLSRKEMGGGNTFDLAANADKGVQSLKADIASFKDKMGRDPTPTEIYMSHQQGRAGVLEHVNNPDQPAWKSMYATGEGQQKGVAWAKKAIWGNIPDDAKARFGNVDNVTSRDLMAIYDSKIRGKSAPSQTEAGQPFKVASVEGTFLPDGRPVAGPFGSKEEEAAYKQELAVEGGGSSQSLPGEKVASDTTRKPGTIYDTMEALPREKLLKRLIEVRDRENVRKSTVEAEGWERKILDAQAGRGELPTHEDIINAPIPDPAKLNTLIRMRDAAEGPIASYRSAFQRFVNKEAFNPYEKEERDNVDKIFGALGGDDVALQSVTSRTGILPASASTKMRADLISNDPKRVIGGMTRAANLITANPNIMEKVDGGKDIETNALKFRYFIDSYGMSADEAANRIVREQTPEHKSAVNAIIKSEDIGAKVKKDLSVNDLAGAFDAGLGILTKNPTVGTNVKTRDLMMDQFAEMTVDNYKNSASGDWSVAKKLAAKQLSKTWGVSAVSSPLGILGGGGILMPYPPEKAPAYQGIENVPEMIAKQAIDAIKAETGTDVERKSLRLDAIPGVTPEDYKAGRPPQYRLSWEDKDGILHMVNPGRAFHADPEAMKAQQTEQRRIGTEAGQAARQEAADKLATDPARNLIGKPIGDVLNRAGDELKDWNARKPELMKGGQQ